MKREIGTYSTNFLAGLLWSIVVSSRELIKKYLPMLYDETKQLAVAGTVEISTPWHSLWNIPFTLLRVSISVRADRLPRNRRGSNLRFGFVTLSTSPSRTRCNLPMPNCPYIHPWEYFGSTGKCLFQGVADGVARLLKGQKAKKQESSITWKTLGMS